MTAKPRLFSYVVARDYGFAPNPFFGYCTLANCKPKIREVAKIGDWVIGTSSIESHKKKKHLVYFMKITDILTFNEYWNDSRFQRKKPVFDKTEKYGYGDNIYHKENGKWQQEISHHRKDLKCINERNLKRDVIPDKLLISDNFGYFGDNPIEIPNELSEIEKYGVGHKSNFTDELTKETIKWLEGLEKGLLSPPAKLTKKKPSEYQNFVWESLKKKKPTRDVLILGLAGEIGSVCSNIKKRVRDEAVQIIDDNDLMEEIGDVLWYLTAICCEYDLKLNDILLNNLNSSNGENKIPDDILYFYEYENLRREVFIIKNSKKNVLFEYCYEINALSNDIFRIFRNSQENNTFSEENKKNLESKLGLLFCYLSVISEYCKISINEIVSYNEIKVAGLFLKKMSDLMGAELYDAEDIEVEQLPRKITAYFYNDEKKMAYVVINSIALGDPLSNNFNKDDGYRYHDGIHFVIYAFLGWSPVWRGFLRKKRKSKKEIDDSQDGARAKIVEEMIVKMIHSYFEEIGEGTQIKSVNTSFLKNIKILTKGLEIENITYAQWEEIIIKSQEIYYNLCDNKGGKLIIDLEKRDIKYKELLGEDKEFCFKSYD